MARKRMIDPGIWSDPTLGELSIEARLLFIGMFSLADDEGRIELNARYLRKEIFGYDDLTVAEVAALVDSVVRICGSVEEYEVAGRHYAVFTTWTRHQRIERPYRSQLPDPPWYEPIPGLLSWSEKRRPKGTVDEQSPNNHRTIDERSRLKEKEKKEKGNERNGAGGGDLNAHVREEPPKNEKVERILNELGITRRRP